MADSFDPYHVWLGIPPEEQPPNYYRLLGIRQFETNPDAIDNMADQRMAHLRTFQTGKNARHSQKLLNEVSAARVCLLNAKAKQEYDSKLQAAMAASQPPTPAPRIVANSQPIARPAPSREAMRRDAAAIAPPLLDLGEPAPLRRPSSVQRTSRNGPWIGVGVALLAVIAIAVGYALMKQSDQSPSDKGDPHGAHPAIAHDFDPDDPKNAAILVFNSSPAGLPDFTLLVDGQQVPLTASGDFEFACRPGRHEVRGTRPGFKPIDTTVTAAARQRQSINLNWQSALALQFKWPIADRKDAELSIDGLVKPLDKIDLEFPLSPGQHTVRIVRPGYRVLRKTISMTLEGCPPLVPVWVPLPGSGSTIAENSASSNRAEPIRPTPIESVESSRPTPAPKLSSIAGDEKPLVRAATTPDEKPAKLAVPDDAALAKATKAVHDLYLDQLKRAATADQKIALAKKLYVDALGTSDDPADKFALLKMARDLAAAQGDFDTASEIVGKLAEQYDVDPFEMRFDLLVAGVKTAPEPEDCSAKLNAFADDAIAADRYESARRALNAALALKCDPAIRKQTAAHQREVGEAEAEFHRLKSTIAAIKAKPDDPEANLAVGKFNCLFKGNWEAGLPMLAKGSDKSLAELAKLDLSGSSAAADQIKLADGWWDTGKRPARLRAKALYEAALPSLGGIARARIEKRLQEVDAKAAETWTNLLRLVDPVKNAVFGKWSKETDGLECTGATYYDTLLIPMDAGGNYEVRTEFTRLTGAADVALYLPINGDHCRVTLGALGRWGGIDTIEGRVVGNRNPTARPAKLENNKRYLLDVAVRTSGTAVEIGVRVNGVDFTSFRGETSQLTSLPNGMRLPYPDQIGIGTQNSTAIFHTLQYRKLPPLAGR
jgi:hypothetical protein